MRDDELDRNYSSIELPSKDGQQTDGMFGSIFMDALDGDGNGV
jgi:hypothetical protein